MTGLVSIVVSVILLFVWPIIFNLLVMLGDGIVSLAALAPVCTPSSTAC